MSQDTRGAVCHLQNKHSPLQALNVICSDVECLGWGLLGGHSTLKTTPWQEALNPAQPLAGPCYSA